jgi:hypothetical protein
MILQYGKINGTADKDEKRELFWSVFKSKKENIGIFFIENSKKEMVKNSTVDRPTLLILLQVVFLVLKKCQF